MAGFVPAIFLGLGVPARKTAQAVALHAGHEASNGVGGRDKPVHDVFAIASIKPPTSQRMRAGSPRSKGVIQRACGNARASYPSFQSIFLDAAAPTLYVQFRFPTANPCAQSRTQGPS